MLTNAHVWREAQERLRPQMTRAQFDTWLRGTRLLTLEQGTAVLAVRTTFAKELLASQYRERIEAALAAVTGRACALDVVVAQGAPADEPGTTEAAVRTRSAARSAEPAHERQARPEPSYANVSLFDANPDARALPRAAPEGATPARRDAEDAEQAWEQVRARSSAKSATARANGLTGGERGITGRSGAPEGPQPQRQPSRPDDDLTRDWMAQGSQGPRRLEGRAEMRTSGDSRSPRDDYDATDLERSDARFTSPLSGSSSGPLPAVSASGVHPAAHSGVHPGVPLLRLNPRYTFKTFIVGSSNQLAYAASVAVGEAPGQAYNPLFLYGGVGLGKTHLLHAVGHATAEQGLSVLYATSETFTNEIVNAIMRRTTEEFRAKYRSVDVLLVDDIQFIAGKDSTEEEFFHTFNSLYESGRQIVICSDRPPKAIVSLEERLRSRFEWGLIADVQPPDFETRIAILRAKAEMMQRHIPDEVIEHLADRVQSNIRELEGSLNRLLAFSTLQRQPLTVELAKAALATLATDARARRVTIQEVLAAVSEYYHISPDDLRGKQRDKHIVVPRQVAMYLMRQETEASLLEIGQSLGGRDHSTVLHGFDKISREINENTALRKEIVAIRQRLLG